MTSNKLNGFAAISMLVLAGVLALAAAGCLPRSEASEPAAAAVEPSPAPGGPSAEDAAEDAERQAAAARLAEQERQLAEREAVLAERERKERERQLAAREAAVAARELAERERRLAEREAALTEREAALDEREQMAARPVETPAPAAEPLREAETYPPPAVARRAIEVTLPAGTEVEVEFQDEVSSATSLPGDRFRTRVVRGVVADGLVAIPAGSRVLGTVTEAVPLKKIGGKARLALELDRLERPSGEVLPIRTSFAEQGRSETKKDAATIGGAAAGGAVLGRILDRKHKDKGTVLGAIVGAAIGTAIASRTPGEEVVIAPGTVIGLHLEEPLRLLVEQ